MDTTTYEFTLKDGSKVDCTESEFLEKGLNPCEIASKVPLYTEEEEALSKADINNLIDLI